MVFEDMGIICYKDEKGEMVCEGYDEGPRYSRQELEEEEKHEKYIQLKRLIHPIKLSKRDNLDCRR